MSECGRSAQQPSSLHHCWAVRGRALRRVYRSSLMQDLLEDGLPSVLEEHPALEVLGLESAGDMCLDSPQGFAQLARMAGLRCTF